eukprot:TRINITY_DN62963_c0_g1_i1.p1 TRINITY_DN62963_c0_g1~~TRINITY_DN62963_c0_g1_i1.p1  ORF type:complete len:277 (+),score=84.78 TRINITY_DN62963_c0_g1_i1:92-922(+)
MCIRDRGVEVLEQSEQEGEQEGKLEEWELGLDQVEVKLGHVSAEVPLVCSTDETAGVECKLLLEIFETRKGEFTEEALDLWRGWQDAKIFGSADVVKSRLDTIVEYGEQRASGDIRQRLRCITFLLQAKPEDYDPVSILLCLAQNGGVCDVQKEVGIRMVYAQMTGRGSSDAEALSLEGTLLQLLQAVREVVIEKLAIDEIDGRGHNSWGEGVYNTHDIFPIRNSFAEIVGLPRVPDPNSTDLELSLIHISEPTRLLSISYAVFCLKKKNHAQTCH